MINPKLKLYLSRLTKSETRNKISFDYSDLSRKGQVKLVKLLKEKSSIITVRTISYQDIDEALTITNPVIFENWRPYFSGGQFPKWQENKLSGIAYHMNKRKIKPVTIREIGTRARLEITMPEGTRGMSGERLLDQLLNN